METPVPNKTPQRKLKRITVKNKLSQKKLKTAINVSLNSSHSLRSLRMNNRSLAHRLEGLKREYRGAYDAYQGIQEENHILRQKVVSLECIIHDPDSYIEEQVNKKLEEFLQMRDNFPDIVHVYTDNLKESEKVSAAIYVRIIRNPRRMCLNDDTSAFNAELHTILVHVRQVKNGIQQLHDNVLGLSLNLKSLDEMCSSHDISTVDRSKRSDSLNGIFSRKLRSLHVSSPFRFQSDINAGNFCAKDTTAHNDEMNMASIDLECSNFNESNNLNTDEVPLCDKSDLETQENMSMISEQSTVFDINSPLKHNEERKTKRVSQEDEHVMKLPRRMVTRSRERKDETMEKERLRTDSVLNVRQSWGMTSTLSEDEENIGLVDVEPPSNLLLSPQLACSIEDNNEQERDIGDPPNLGNPPVTGCHISKEKMNTQYFKISRPEINKRVPKVQRQAGLGPAKGNDALFISNEFALNNVHQQIAEKLSAMQTEPTKACEKITGRDYRDEEDHTVHIEEDMELTMPIIIDVNMSHASENHDLNIKEEMSVSSNSQEPDGEEVCPEAVTLQRMKPGQIKFAASRKETDGSRKILLTQPPRARSKSKKAIAEMIENLPPEEPKSIFDFHDKTPTLISGKDRDMSVYSLRDESSVMSLPTPLGKRRKSQLPDKDKVDFEGPVNERENSTQSKRVFALGEGISYSIPLKDDSHNNEKSTVGKSRSRSRSQTARERSRSRARCVSNEEPEALNNDKDPCVPSDMISVLDKAPKDDSNNNDKVTVRNSRSKSQSKAKSAISENEHTNCSKDMAGNVMVTVRKSRSQSRNREERTGSLSRVFADEQPAVDSDDVLGNMKESTRCSEKISALGDGLKYSIPLKDDSDYGGKAAPRKSRGRSRSRARASDKNQSSDNSQNVLDSGMNPDIHHDNTFVLGEGKTYSIPVKDESDNSKKLQIRKSRGRSRTRTKTVVEEHQLSQEETSINSTQISVLGKGSTYSVPLKDDKTDTTETVTVRKSRGRSRSRIKDLSEGLSSVNSQNDLQNEKDYSVPLKDDAEAVTISKSRGRSKTRTNGGELITSNDRTRSRSQRRRRISPGEPCDPVEQTSMTNDKLRRQSKSKERAEETNNCERAVNGKAVPSPKKIVLHVSQDLNVQDKNSPSQKTKTQISVLGKGSTYSVPLKDDKTDTTETVTVRKSRGRSRSRIKDLSEELSSVNSQNDLQNEKDYSVPLKDDAEAVTISKSRGRSKTRTNGGELITSNDRTRSRSQRRRRISPGEPCDPVEQTSTIKDKLRRQSKSKERAEETNNCERAVNGKAVPSPKKIVLHVSQDLNVQDKNSPSQKTKTESRGSDKTEQGILEDLQKKALNEDFVSLTSDENQANSSKQKDRPKSHKKMHESKERIKKCEAKISLYPTDVSLSPLVTKNGETLRSEFPPQIFTEMVATRTLRDISRTCSPKTNVNVNVNATANIKSIERVQLSTSVDISDVPKDLKETPLKRPSDINEDSVADAVVKISQGAVGHRNKRKKPKTNVGGIPCNSQEEFESQLNHLKNMCTLNSFKMKTKSPKSTSSSSFETRDQSTSSPTHSLSDSLLQTSASGETNSQQSCEPSRQRRAAVKAVNYAEPLLTKKLRRGDPITMMGPGKMLVYNSPKAQKKTKRKRNNEIG